MTPKGGLGMAEYHGFKKQYVETGIRSRDVEFVIEPSNWLRRLVKCWYYWVGDEARFRIRVKGADDRPLLGRLAIYEDLPRPSHWKALEEPHRLVANPYEAAFRRDNKPPKCINVVGSRIVEPGSCRYTVGYPGDEGAEVVVGFEAKPKETVLSAVLYFLSIVVSALLGGGIGGYLGYYLAKG